MSSMTVFVRLSITCHERERRRSAYSLQELGANQDELGSNLTDVMKMRLLDEAYVRIHDASERSGLPEWKLRYLDRIGVVRALRRGAHRLYGPEQFNALEKVKVLTKQGFPPAVMPLVEESLRPSGHPDRGAVAHYVELLRTSAKSRREMQLRVETFAEYNAAYKRLHRLANTLGYRISLRKQGSTLFVMAASGGRGATRVEQEAARRAEGPRGRPRPRRMGRSSAAASQTARVDLGATPGVRVLQVRL